MPSRPLAALAVAALLVISGCLGGSAVPTPSTETQSETTPATSGETATATPATPATTTARPCSLDGVNATLPAIEAPANLSTATAGDIAETVESRIQSARVEEHSYFNHHTNVAQIEEVEGGYRVVLGGELDYDYRENGTVTHLHRPYTATYLVTDRKVVRRGEAGTTGTVVCWSPNQ